MAAHQPLPPLMAGRGAEGSPEGRWRGGHRLQPAMDPQHAYDAAQGRLILLFGFKTKGNFQVIWHRIYFFLTSCS